MYLFSFEHYTRIYLDEYSYLGLMSHVKFIVVEETGAEVKAVCRSGNLSNERMRTSGEDKAEDGC